MAKKSKKAKRGTPRRARRRDEDGGAAGKEEKESGTEAHARPGHFIAGLGRFRRRYRKSIVTTAGDVCPSGNNPEDSLATAVVHSTPIKSRLTISPAGLRLGASKAFASSPDGIPAPLCLDGRCAPADTEKAHRGHLRRF